jgi:hypothetical protein
MRIRPVCMNVLVAFGVLFAVVVPADGHVILDDPNGGEVFEAGTVVTVSWRIQIQHLLQNWDLWYSTTGAGGPWISIAQNLPPGSPSPGSVHTYEWTVPESASTQVRVRVRMDNAGTDYEDVSNFNFTIELAAVAGDGDGDGDVDLIDVDAFVDCESGPGGGVAGGCSAFDLDGDDDVDFGDFAELQLSYTG